MDELEKVVLVSDGKVVGGGGGSVTDAKNVKYNDSNVKDELDAINQNLTDFIIRNITANFSNGAIKVNLPKIDGYVPIGIVGLTSVGSTSAVNSLYQWEINKSSDNPDDYFINAFNEISHGNNIAVVFTILYCNKNCVTFQ